MKRKPNPPIRRTRPTHSVTLDPTIAERAAARARRDRRTFSMLVELALEMYLGDAQ